ncbi:YciI-like protein [Stakelama tenebrarum]|uniref:YCII-related domain-containing protein n=1 Tax=Stakelama tenebrarum TaxID=2711215 RepID=A0A6G6Y3B1_9SPHN|nr:YciI-like protein [Sphingosinithalassobacter tenebrarum]QIG79297.1 hypothetical protein G5C33_05490 [Sphingosinithalassobacter tenebrarum]
MAHWLLTYTLAPYYMNRREEVRVPHLAKAQAAADAGDLILAGALVDPLDTALLLFQGDGPEAAEEFARTDPYVTEGLVTHWTVRQWYTVAGKDAAMPMPPVDG